ncbi:MAG TPA: ferrochelatase [Polyangiaceae bacterium LLY-WYZ-14_1]|nr:ferrochelatase [Polyangiaceae bacterium LLY-WYZ-14_1]
MKDSPKKEEEDDDGDPRDPHAATERLVAVDEVLSRGSRRTAAPGRDRATSLTQLVGELLNDEPGPEAPVVEAFVDAVAAVARAILEHFPENVFWDLDLLVASIWRGAARDPVDPVGRIVAMRDRLVGLQALYGRATPIRFRYAHDFIYGYDWARWVRRDPAARRQIGPYDLAFLDRMARRGAELLTLIERDDTTYPTLRDAGHRNPYRFSREPPAEAQLFEDLAARDLLPVPAWDPECTPVWDRSFLDLREERARALGLTG